VKLRSAPLDDVFNELQFACDLDGRRFARIVRRLFTCAYRVFRALMLAALRLPWNTSATGYPEIGTEPFNLTDTELENRWGSR
jgi:hypothetical protein